MESTPLPTIALVSRVVTMVCDRVLGDRGQSPILVAFAAEKALQNLGLGAQVFYGHAAWVEITSDNKPRWVGAWQDEHFHFWAATQFGEIVDLNTSISARLPSGETSGFSPPMVWSSEVPRFFRYKPIGHVDLDFPNDKARQDFDRVLAEINEKCTPAALKSEVDASDFVNEPIICPDRKILDDSKQTFKNYERALGVLGIPDCPLAV